MISNSRQIKKYRPVLSESAISHIILLCKQESPLSQESMEVISILAPFEAKIQNAGVSAAYVANPKQSMEEKLGLGEAVEKAQHSFSSSSNHPSPANPEQKRYTAYMKWMEDSADCTLEEILLADTYRYEKGLMGQIEQDIYEVKIFHVKKV